MILRGLYAITDASLMPAATFLDQAAQALAGGAVMVQYRHKGNDIGFRRGQAEALNALCIHHRAMLIVNDDPDLARLVGAAGVHLGRDDASIRHARRILGPGAVIGVSCYDRFDLAREAAGAGADYVAFGSFYPSATKPDAPRAQTTLIERAKCELGIPVAAIGGITVENAEPLIAAGADLLAVITAVFGTRNVRQAAERFTRLYGRPSTRRPTRSDPQ